MKKILILLSVMCVSLITKGQLNLLHSFQNNSDYGYALYEKNAWEAVMEPVDYYILPGYDFSQVNIYNQNFVLIKQIDLTNFPISSPNPSIYPTQTPGTLIRCLGKHLINADDKIEFLVNVNFVSTSSLGGQISKKLIVNEDKEIVFGFDLDVSNFSDIYKIGNQLVLITNENTYYNSSVTTQKYYNIYSLGGNYNPGTMVTYTRKGDYPNPYPNPTQNTITLPYTLHSNETTQLKVFNINGQLMETFNIGSDFDRILLNVNDYPKGTYIYTYNGVSKKFVVQ